jgi:D-alanine-D-alanine ligase
MGTKAKVAVLAGGIGSERQVSLMSGQNIFVAVEKAGFDAVLSDITPDNLSVLDDKSIDVFFLALHGEFGEDGGLQRILEERGLCFTGSDSRTSELAFDKAASKEAFRRASVTTPRDVCIYATTDAKELSERISKFGEKFVIKPIKEGSSVGVEIISGPKAAAQGANKCVAEFGDCMIEEFIEGEEITAGIVDGQVLPIIKIVTKTEFYDYYAKYIDDATEYLFDTVQDKEAAARINESALKSFNCLGCRHFGRVDMILTEAGRPSVLEVNTLPGFTSHSLLPMAAARAGMATDKLCARIIAAALKNPN